MDLNILNYLVNGGIESLKLASHSKLLLPFRALDFYINWKRLAQYNNFLDHICRTWSTIWAPILHIWHQPNRKCFFFSFFKTKIGIWTKMKIQYEHPINLSSTFSAGRYFLFPRLQPVLWNWPKVESPTGLICPFLSWSEQSSHLSIHTHATSTVLAAILDMKIATLQSVLSWLPESTVLHMQLLFFLIKMRRQV